MFRSTSRNFAIVDEKVINLIVVLECFGVRFFDWSPSVENGFLCNFW